MADNIINNTNQFGGGGYPPPPPAAATINCELQVALSPENIVVYVCRGTKQCFNFTALSCCGKENIIIKYDDTKNPSMNGQVMVFNFGTFSLNVSGICFEPDDKLGKDSYPTDKDLYFIASACGVEIPFVVHFVYDPCKCCCKCRKCK